MQAHTLVHRCIHIMQEYAERVKQLEEYVN